MDYFQREFSIMKLRSIPNYGIENHAPMDGDQSSMWRNYIFFLHLILGPQTYIKKTLTNRRRNQNNNITIIIISEAQTEECLQNLEKNCRSVFFVTKK